MIPIAFFMIPKSYTKFLDAHMTQCELVFASGFGVTMGTFHCAHR